VRHWPTTQSQRRVHDMLQLDQYIYGWVSHRFNIPDDEGSWKQNEGQYNLASLGELQDRDHCYWDAEQNEIVDEG
jgi:hypothetical protein